MQRAFLILTVACTACVLSSCSGARSASDADLDLKARRLAEESLIVDTHIDLPMRLREKWEDITVLHPEVDFDYVRARTGGLDVPFMSVYIPAEAERRGTAAALADTLIQIVERIAETWPDKFAVARSTRDVDAQQSRGLMSLVMGMENGAPLSGDLNNVRRLHDRGIRYITLCHGLDNHICDSSYDTTRTWRGLSPFGKTLIPEMNRVGIMVDVAHVTDDVCSQVLDISTAPIIASHSSCRAFTPGFERNLPDSIIVRIGRNGGAVMINFGSEFLTSEFQKWEEQRLEAVRLFILENAVPRRDPRVREFLLDWRRAHPVPYATVGNLVDHIDHVVTLAGIDHVGLGSDFEGVGDMLPVGLKDVSGYPSIIAELLKRGYSEDNVKKICGGNLMRIWKEVETRAEVLSR